MDLGFLLQSFNDFACQDMGYGELSSISGKFGVLTLFANLYQKVLFFVKNINEKYPNEFTEYQIRSRSQQLFKKHSLHQDYYKNMLKIREADFLDIFKAMLSISVTFLFKKE